MLSILPLAFVEVLVATTIMQRSNMTDELSETMAVEDLPEVGPFCRAVASVGIVVISRCAASAPTPAACTPELVALCGPTNTMSRTCAQMLGIRNSVVTWLTPTTSMMMTLITLTHSGMSRECGWWNNPLRREVMLRFSRPLLNFLLIVSVLYDLYE